MLHIYIKYCLFFCICSMQLPPFVSSCSATSNHWAVSSVGSTCATSSGRTGDTPRTRAKKVAVISEFYVCVANALISLTTIVLFYRFIVATKIAKISLDDIIAICVDMCQSITMGSITMKHIN